MLDIDKHWTNVGRKQTLDKCWTWMNNGRRLGYNHYDTLKLCSHSFMFLHDAVSEPFGRVKK